MDLGPQLNLIKELSDGDRSKQKPSTGIASPHGKKYLAPMLESDLADLSVRELLSMLLSSVGLAERKAYLERIFPDQPNGFYDRSLHLGAIPVEIRVPRTRSGDFRPASLPPLYQHGYSDETQALLLSLLTSGRSLHAVKDACGRWGFPAPNRNWNRWPPA